MKQKKAFQSLTARGISDLCAQEDIEVLVEDDDDDEIPEGADPRVLWIGRILGPLFREDLSVTVDDIRVTRYLTDIEREGRRVTLKTYEFVPLAELEKGSSEINVFDLGAAPEP
jgi:hypothetical protein